MSRSESLEKDSVHNLTQDFCGKSRIHSLNISKITEQALLSIIDYFKTQKAESSNFLMNVLFQKKVPALYAPEYKKEGNART